MPVWPVQDLISLTQDQLDDEEEDQWTEADLVRYLDYALGFYELFMAEWAINHVLESKDISHDGSTELTRIAPFMPRIFSVERTTDDPRTERIPIEAGFHGRFGFLQQSGETLEGYSQWYLNGTRMGIIPVPGSGNTDRVWYIKRHPGLHYGTVATADTGTSFTLPASPTAGNIVTVDDEYNELPLWTNDDREVRTITDFTSARVVTLDAALTTTPTTSTVYSILAKMPPETQPLIAFKATRLGNMRTDESNVDIDNEIASLETLLRSFIGKPQEQRPRYVQTRDW